MLRHRQIILLFVMFAAFCISNSSILGCSASNPAPNVSEKAVGDGLNTWASTSCTEDLNRSLGLAWPSPGHCGQMTNEIQYARSTPLQTLNLSSPVNSIFHRNKACFKKVCIHNKNGYSPRSEIPTKEKNRYFLST